MDKKNETQQIEAGEVQIIDTNNVLELLSDELETDTFSDEELTQEAREERKILKEFGYIQEQ